MGRLKRPVTWDRLAILKALREYPDATARQIASLLGVKPNDVSMVRNDYGLHRKRHPPLLGKRPVPKQFRNRWKQHEAR